MDKKDTSSLVQTGELPLLSEEEFDQVSPYGNFICENNIVGNGISINVTVFDNGNLVTVIEYDSHRSNVLYQEFLRGKNNGAKKEEGK